MKSELGLSQPSVYRICVQGGLEDRWARWFEGMTLERDDTCHMTILTGAVPDQTALHGLLARIRDLGLPLLSVTRVASDGSAEVGNPKRMAERDVSP